MKKLLLALLLFPMLAQAGLRGTAVNATTSTSASNVVTISGIGIVNGDQILCSMGAGGASGANTLTPPAGFSAITSLTQQNLAGKSALMVWQKTASSEPSTYTFTLGTADLSTVVCRVYSTRSGTITAKTLTAAANIPGTPPSAIPVSGLTAATGDDIVLFIGIDNGSINNGNTYVVSTPTGFANGLTTYAAATDFTPAIGSSDDVNAASGATGTLATTLTWNGAAPNQYAGFLISLPAAAVVTHGVLTSGGHPVVSGTNPIYN